ncbi:MAG: HAD family phosphatase [Verrucomicrobia bacterium]|nr:HAD family phosphatase [Verrucomicrobiota bacterium]
MLHPRGADQVEALAGGNIRQVIEQVLSGKRVSRQKRVAKIKPIIRKTCKMETDAQLETEFPYRLSAIDLDGTLLGPDKTISEQNAAAVRRLKENGSQVIIASGRRHQNSIRFQRQLRLTGPIIACQGGLIRDGESGNVIEAHFLPQAVAREIVEEAEKNRVQAIYYHLDHLFVPERNDRWIDLYESRVGERAETLPDLRQLDGRRALKIVWYGDPGILKRIRPTIALQYDGKVDVLSTESENLEFMPRGINKAAALEKVAREYSVLREQVLAFGDGENDVQMLEWAGMGVAMRHGNAAAIAAARMVSPPGPPETAFARAVDALFEKTAKNNQSV